MSSESCTERGERERVVSLLYTNPLGESMYVECIGAVEKRGCRPDASADVGGL